MTSPRLPDYCVVGAMKSGTTAIARYLEAHPDCFLAPGKEVHFFDRHFERGAEWYAGLFAAAAPGVVVGEATPNYLHDPEVPRRFYETSPRTKLVAILRNPVDRAYSHYWHERARGREDLDFASAVEREAERLASGSGFSHVHHSYLDRGRYLEQLLRFEGYFGRSAMCVVLLEDLQADPPATFSVIADFLGVRPEAPAMVGRPVNTYVSFRSLRVRRLSKAVPAPAGRVLGRLNVRKRPYPEMEPELRRKLLAGFEDPNRALGQWLGRDLSVWDR